MARSSGEDFNKYATPRHRSARNLAVIRRGKLLKPTKLALQKCEVCSEWARLGCTWGRGCHKQKSSRKRRIARAEPRFICQPCWKSWNFSCKQWWVDHCSWVWDYYFYQEPDWPRPPPMSERPSGQEEHFDFIEIGTSHFHTFVQAIVDHPDGKPYAWNFLPWYKHPLELRGLAVDMVQRYLDHLPDLPNVTKLCAAISDREEITSCHHVPLASVERWEKIFAKRGSWKGHRAIRLARGCSALTKHRILRGVLKKTGLLHLIRRKRVRTIKIAKLLDDHRVASIGTLALDCEGHDCSILQGFMAICDSKPALWPEWIWFESNSMSDEMCGEGMEEETVRQLRLRGYELWWGGGYRNSGKRDTVLRYNPWAMEGEFQVN